MMYFSIVFTELARVKQCGTCSITCTPMSGCPQNCSKVDSPVNEDMDESVGIQVEDKSHLLQLHQGTTHLA
eukprot:569047-Amphidinium_carterae.2